VEVILASRRIVGASPSIARFLAAADRSVLVHNVPMQVLGEQCA
jgi:hypothetical protein